MLPIGCDDEGAIEERLFGFPGGDAMKMPSRCCHHPSRIEKFGIQEALDGSSCHDGERASLGERVEVGRQVGEPGWCNHSTCTLD